jgi:hypothetical protein
MQTIFVGVVMALLIILLSITITTGIRWYEQGMNRLRNKYTRK